MVDKGHLQTDKELQKLEKKIYSVYKEANEEAEKQAKKYFSEFNAEDKEKRKLVEDGKLTEKEYKQWRREKLLKGNHYKKMRDMLAKRMLTANEDAVKFTNEAMPTMYSINRNFTAKEIEDTGVGASFDLYDEATVRRLIVENPELLPNYPKEKAIKRGIDLDYNKGLVFKQIQTGILLGESNQDIAKRLTNGISTMNFNSAIRTARTATTSAECGGRQDTYTEAKKMGIVLKKKWLATHDSRTREEHIHADGQIVDTDKPFIVGGEKLMFPGDSSGSGYNIYNCRCSTIAVVDIEASAKNRGKYNFDSHSQTYTAQKNIDSEKNNTAKVPRETEKQKISERVEKPSSKVTSQKPEFYTAEGLKTKSRAQLIKIAKPIYIKSNVSQGLSEAEAIRRFDLLINGNTTPQLRKYIIKHQRKV